MPNRKKPTHLKKVQGTFRKDRAQANEPEPENGRPTCPGVLTGEAKREWNRVTNELEEMGMLHKIDRSNLTAYCLYWEMFIETTKAIQEKQTLIHVTPNGHEQPLPEISIRHQALDRMLKISADFGFNPVARTKINAAPKPPEKENPFLRFAER